jgi:hypothetical protein
MCVFCYDDKRREWCELQRPKERMRAREDMITTHVKLFYTLMFFLIPFSFFLYFQHNQTGYITAEVGRSRVELKTWADCIWLWPWDSRRLDDG